MYHNCLVCSRPFEENESLEQLPRGGRIAFDPGRGRLWIICKGCRAWSLAPIEERWEALDELEKLTRDKAKLLSSTDNISLFVAGPVEVVRVGRAQLREEAWWRYGRELLDRRAKAKKLTALGTVTTGAILVGGFATGGPVLIGAWLGWDHLPDAVNHTARWLRFGNSAWKGHTSCAHCGRMFTSLNFREKGSLYLLPDANGHVSIGMRCTGCGRYEDGGLRLSGREGERALRRVLAHQHFKGASEKRIRTATHLIESAGSVDRLQQLVVGDGKRLADLEHTTAIALEIAANEVTEQRLLELELDELERRWKEEEELADISDTELSPIASFDAFRRRITGR
jgi:hypothetical protein